MHKLFSHAACLTVCAFVLSARAQTTYYIDGLLRQPSAAAARNYLGISSVPGGGTVTTFSAGNLGPLFTSSVANPATTPALSFSQIAQNANLVFAGPSGGGPVAPSFRALTASDIPPVPYVSSVSLTMPAEFSVGGSPVTGSGTLAVTKANESANTVFAGPVSGIPSAPTFRALINTDLGSFTNHSDVTLTTLNPGDSLVWSGSAWTNGPAPSGAATASDLLQSQTNYMTTYRVVDISPSSPTLVGFGDALGITSSSLRSVYNVGDGPWMEIGTSSSSGNVAFTGGTANFSLPSTNGNAMYWQAMVEVRNTASARYFFGVSSTAAGTMGANDNNSGTYAVFRFSTSASDTTWQCITHDGTGGTTNNSGVTVNADTPYLLQIIRNDSNGSVDFLINRTTTVNIATHVPNTEATLMTPQTIVTTLTTATKTNRVRYIGYRFATLQK